MTNPFRTLALQPIRNADIKTHSVQGLDLTLASQAFQDFRHGRPLVLEKSTSADRATKLMRKAHVDLRRIVDADDHFLGVVSRHMLAGHEVVRIRYASTVGPAGVRKPFALEGPDATEPVRSCAEACC